MSFEDMYFELLEKSLEVVLVPAPEPKHSIHMIRVCQSKNPDWYRKFCEQYPANRRTPRTRGKFDTKIKRQHTIKALENILRGKTKGVYVERLRRFAETLKPRPAVEYCSVCKF